MRLDDGPDGGGELGVIVFESRTSTRGKVFDAADAGAEFVLSKSDVGSSPAEASFGSSRAAVAKSCGDLGLEASSRRSGERLGGELKEFVGGVRGVIHDWVSGGGGGRANEIISATEPQRKANLRVNQNTPNA